MDMRPGKPDVSEIKLPPSIKTDPRASLARANSTLRFDPEPTGGSIITDTPDAGVVMSTETGSVASKEAAANRHGDTPTLKEYVALMNDEQRTGEFCSTCRRYHNPNVSCRIARTLG
jgi:hypothetical protein